MVSTKWISILLEEKKVLMKENQWKITGFLIFVFPFLLLIITYFVDNDNPIIPRIFDGLILNIILIGVVLSSIIVPFFLFWESLNKINSIDKLKNEIIIRNLSDDLKIIEQYKKIVKNSEHENKNESDS